MAIAITDNRIVLDQADATTGWVSTDGPTVFTTGPTPIEAGGCLGLQASSSIENAYVPITSDNYSAGGSLFIWMTNRAAFDTTVNGGVGIQVGDGTNRIAYHVGGSDGTGFRHEEGPVDWANFQIDLANKPTNFTAIAGAEANLNEAAITQVGVYFETIAKSVGGADNCFWDIIRFADNGVGIEVSGGTVGTPETVEQVTIEDRNEGNLRAHGIIRKVGSGAYSIQGNISWGDATGTANTYINSTGETFLWEDRGQSTANYYRFNAVGNGTGVTDLNFDNCTWTCPTSGSIDVSDANVDAFDVRGTVITGFDVSINTGGSNNIWTDNTYSGCGTLTTTGTNISGSTFSLFTGIADDSQVFWNSTTDPNTNIADCTFTKNTADTHAIEFPTGKTTGNVTIDGCVFNNYSGTNNVNGSVLNFLGTTGAVTVNVTNTTGTVSYKTAGTTITIVNAVAVTLTGLQDNSEIRVMEAGSNTVELAGTETATVGTAGNRSFTFSLSAGTSVDIYIVSILYENVEIEGYVVPGTASSLPIQQRFDRSYLNP